MEIPEGDFRHIFLFYFIENCVVFMVTSAQVNASVRICLFVFVPEMSMLKMNLALAVQPLKKSMKFFEKSR